VNLEYPPRWQEDESYVRQQSHSREASVESQIQSQDNPNFVTSSFNDNMIANGMSGSQWSANNSQQMHPDELRTPSSKIDKEGETYQTFLKMIKEKNRQNDEIKIHN